ncbi:hypothetical protein F5Y06DRAFT_13963 [Hypoxylon sp. FL0890]|nr:hypothetical protein F5Y06DRAFT_13963 [Hypoxylon sp. FL0890]
MRPQTIVLLVAPVAALAATPRARSGLPKSFAQTNILNTLDTCGAGRTTCENGCMPIGAVCCNDNTDEYCQHGYYCVPNACCPDGEVCSGSSNDDAGCAVGETKCGDLCMPLTGTCCGDGLHYCPDFGTCTSDGYCCDVGDNCDGSSFTDFTTATDNDFTSTTSRTTTRTQTTTSTIDEESTSTTSSRTTSTTSTSPTSSTSSSTTSETNTNAVVTPAPTVNTVVSQQAGGVFTADGKVAAGLAVIAAFLV